MKKQLYIRLISLVALLSATLPVSANRIITKTEVYEFYDEPYDWDGVGFYSQDPLTEEENTNWRGNNFEYYGDKTLKGEGNSTENIYLETITSLPGRVTKVTIEAKAWTTEGWVWMNVNNGDDEEIQTTDQYDMDAISYEDYVFNNPTDNGGYLKISFSLSTYARIYIRSITVEYEYEVPNEPYALLSNDNKTLTFYYDDQKDLNDYLSVGPFDDPEDQSWKDHKESITTVNFANSFANYTALSSTRYWFHNCENLTTFNNLSNLKTSQVTDMVGMFGGCSSLTALDLSSFDTGNVLDMRRMFNSCSNLTNLDVSSFNTSKVTKMGGMFNDCPSLESLDITNFNTSKVTDMSLMFSGCSSLVSLDLSNFNTAAVTTMTHMFYGCTNLTTITVACEWNTDAVTESSDMFLDCTSIKGRKGTTYDASHVDKSYAHNDEGASNPGYLTDKLEVYAIEESESGKYVLTFYYDNKKKTRDYPKSIGPFSSFNAVSWYSHAYWFNTVRFDSSMAECTNITSTAYWFYGFTELTTIEGLEYLNTSNVTDMAGMFGHCYQMTSIDVSHFDTSNVTDMSAMFNMCTYLTSIDVSHFNTSNVTNMESMFNDCMKLTILDLSSFNTANVTTMSRMFEGCQELKRLDLSSFNTNNVTNPWSMFSGCSSLTRIYVSDQWKASSLGYTSGMFSNCTSLVGGAGTVYDSNHTDGSYAHIDGGTDNPGYLTERGIEPYAVLSSDNKTLTFKYDMEWGANALSIGPFDGYSERGWYDHKEDITKVVFDDSFAQYTGLTSTFTWFDQSSNIATIEGLHNLNTENVVNMRSMFEECSSLTSLDLSNFNTAKVTDFGNMFAGCSNLATIYVGEGWSTEAVTEESTYMFGGCTSLVGGAGTTYADVYKDVAYAHIDDTSNPGYLTDANLREPYAVLTDNDDNVTTDEGTVKGKTLTFYYDTQKESRGGMSVGPFDINSGASWKSERDKITSVVFDDTFADFTSLTSTAQWFFLCSKLKTITGVANLKTDNVTIMYEMFEGCHSLTSLDVSGFNTKNVTSMTGMFKDCSSLTSLDVSGFNTKNVTSMHSMFYGCSSLTSLDVSGFNTENVTGMDYMFDGCSRLTNLDVTRFKTDKVTSMYLMFAECSNLTSLDVSRFKTDKVTIMNGMFSGCSSLTSLDVSGFNTENVKNMAGLFSGCSSLTNLNVSGFNTENVTNMGGMFDGCSGLASLDVSGFNTNKVTNMEWMFEDCSSLTSLDVSGFKTDKVTSMKWMFYGCSSLTSLDVSGFNTENVTEMDYMFRGCSRLTSLDLSGFNTDNVTNMRDMFSGCSSLTSLDVSGFKTDEVTSMKWMFYGCSSLTSLDVSGFNTENVASMVGMFEGCSCLTSLDVSGFNTTNVTDIHSMFYGCSSLTSLDLSSFNISKVEYDADNDCYGIEYMFSGCSALTTIYVGEGWNVENLTEGTYVFKDCTALVGGEGTKYDVNHIDKDYAHIDGGTSNPGYFTDKNKKDVTITAKSYSREYCDTNPTFEYTVDGATLSGTPTITCEATATSPVGTYPIVVTYTAEDAAKMNLTFVNGTLTITKAPLTITAKSYIIKRGEAIPTLEVEYSGFKNNETYAVFTKKPTVSTEAKSDALAGTYDIVVSGAEATNYEIEYVNGTLTITDDVTVTAKNYSRVYGDANPTFEFTSEGATLSGTPTITCEATATSPVGTYDIVIAKGSISNGTVTYVNGTLTITKAPLTITAKSYSVKQGKELPTLELEYSGFKNNETDTVFTTKPTATTRATKNSDPGTYDITVSGAEAKNYEIKYVNGTLTITERTETFNGTVLTVNEGGNLDDAFESIGGREEAAKTIAAIIWNNNVPLTDDMLEGISNPNLLIYVSEASMAPESTKNLIVDGKAKNIVLVDAEGNNNFFVPQEFTADSISYSRTFKQTTQDGISRGWEGIALPFNVQKFIHEEHGEISPFGDSNCDYHFWLRQPTNEGVINALIIEANKPYIISMPNSNEYEPEFNHPGLLKFTSTNVTVPVTKVESVWLGDSAQIVPTFQNIEASPDIYVLNVGDSIMDQTEGSIFISNYRSARPFEVYTFHEPRSNETNIFGSRIISLSSLFGGNGTTGVNDAMKTAEPNGETWYNMNGRRLQGKPARKGVYILNGKKVVVK